MKAMEDFRQSLSGLADVMRRLVESAREQKDALLANDLPGIEASCSAQEELLTELSRIQAACSLTLAEWKKSLNLPEEETLAGLTCDRPEAAVIRGLWQEILKNMGSLREATATNRVLATRAVAFYRKVTGIIQPERQAGTYAGTGRLREARIPVISRVV
ncbi:MAG: flagellar protein FlgN [Peptococcaceae bacterium]|jgi:flagellar biosynthesis/type III secretory pathway chaperone|nr:flagellar protein FlgN [Peptococcaceae bacterium]